MKTLDLVSDVEYWWDHLTYDQQVFILHRVKAITWNGRFKEEFFQQVADIRWYTIPGWPETPMRVV